MKKYILLIFLFLTSCVSSHYYTPLGDECTSHWVWPAFAWKDCIKGERTGNLNLNMNLPQHDPTIGGSSVPPNSSKTKGVQWRDVTSNFPGAVGKNIQTVIKTVGAPVEIQQLKDGWITYLWNFPKCAIVFGTKSDGIVSIVAETGMCETAGGQPK